MASSLASGTGQSAQEFEPYRSVLRFSSAPSRLSTPLILQGNQVSGERETETRFPPWRRPVGKAFFLLNSHFAKLYGEDIPGEEADQYVALLQTTFSGYSEEKVGVGAELSHLDVVWCGEGGAEWTVDEWPMQASIEGYKTVLYDLQTEVGSFRPGQVCWNCRGLGHVFHHCLLPRNDVQIRTSRENFQAARDAMPEHAIPYLPAYSQSSSAETKVRRMQLLDRFQPGRVSEELAEAVWWILDEEDEDEEEREEMEVKRQRCQWPWLLAMVRWGYPPGWIAGKDPRDEIRRRIRLEPESGDAFVAGEEEDLLQVFGGDLGLPFSPESILPTSTTIPQVTSKEILTSRASDAQVTPVAKRVHQTAPPDDSPPLPPPPEGSPPPLPSSPVSQNQPSWPSLPPLMHKRRIPQTRWARYDTDLFHSDRLTAYSGAQPLPLGFLFFKPQHPPRRPPYYASVMPT